MFFFFFQAEDGIRDVAVTGVQTCALPISPVLLAARVRVADPGALDDVAAALRADASVAAEERNAIAWSHVAGAPRSTAAATTATDSFAVYQAGKRAAAGSPPGSRARPPRPRPTPSPRPQPRE